MTVTYTPDVHDASYKSLIRMMVRWRGSLWKTVVKDLLAWLTTYAVISCTYRLVLDDQHKRFFERVVHYCYKFSDWVPLTFMLGFYVTLVLTRWWSIISNIGFIDNLSLVVSNYIRGSDSRSIMYKRTIVRYMCLMQAMVYRAICKPVKTKFPTLDSLVDAGYLEPDEKELFSENNFFLSVHWAMAMARKARDEKLIASDQALQDIFKWCTDFRWSQVVLWVYHWIPVPLVYSQVVFISVRFYFILALVGRQYIEGELSLFPIDIYFPILTVLQFIFYIGWLKVAEALLNPFGEDDDDFDAEWFMARNLRIGLAVVSEENREPPTLKFDKFWRDEHSKEHEMEEIKHKPRIRRTSEPTFASTNLLEISSGEFEANENGEIVPRRRTLLTLIYDSAARIVHVESPHGIHESIPTSQLSTDGDTAHRKSQCTHHDAANGGTSFESRQNVADDVERGCVNSAFDSVDSAFNDEIVEHNGMY